MGAALAAVLALTSAACVGDTDAAPTGKPSAVDSLPTASPTPSAASANAADGQRHPDVVQAVLERQTDGTYDVQVTLSSPYDTPGRYADGWRVLTPAGEQIGTHTLAHDHADEQPFTRVQRGLTIPEGVSAVVVEGRDLTYGYGGGTVQVDVPGR